jgi:hypothetical protein
MTWTKFGQDAESGIGLVASGQQPSDGLQKRLVGYLSAFPDTLPWP